MDIIEKITRTGLVLDTDELMIYGFLKDQMMSSDSQMTYAKGRKWIALNKGVFLKKYPVFNDRSSQWFSAKVRSLCQKKILMRLEDTSFKIGFGDLHYHIQGEAIPKLEVPVQEPVVKAEKKNVEPKLSLEERKAKFVEDMKAWIAKNPKKYSKQTYTDFYLYWTEKSEASKKLRYPHLRFEAQEFFEIGKRLATWVRNGYNSQGTALVLKKGRTE